MRTRLRQAQLLPWLPNFRPLDSATQRSRLPLPYLTCIYIANGAVALTVHKSSFLSQIYQDGPALAGPLVNQSAK